MQQAGILFFIIFNIINSLLFYYTQVPIPSYLLNKITFLHASHISLVMTRQDWYVQVISLTTTNKVGGKRYTEAQSPFPRSLD